MTDTTTVDPVDAAPPEDPPPAELPDPEDTTPDGARAEVVLHRQEHPHPMMGDLPVVPAQAELHYLAQLAVTFSAAELVPKALRGKPNDVLLVLLTARDLGLTATTALRECHPIDGKVTVSPKLKLGIVRSRGLGRVWPDPRNSGESATWYSVRADDPEGTVVASTFEWEDAQSADLLCWDCTGPRGHSDTCRTGDKEWANGRRVRCKSNYRTYPKRMMSWRALGYLLDDEYSEVGTGLYSPDEIGAVTDEDGNPVLDVMEVGPLQGMREPAGRANAKAAAEAQAAAEAPADPEVVADLGARIGVLPLQGRTVLQGLWRERLTHPLRELQARHVAQAKALVDLVERRAKGGEWGPWPPGPDGGAQEPQQEGGQEAATAPDSTHAGPPAPEGTTVPPEAPAATQDPDPEVCRRWELCAKVAGHHGVCRREDGEPCPDQDQDMADQCITFVHRLSQAQLLAACRAAGVSTAGRHPARQARLAQHYLEHGLPTAPPAE